MVREGGGTGTFANVVIANNLCFNNVLDGIKVTLATEVDIRGNQCPDNVVYGIDIASCTDALVEGNTIIGSGTQAIRDGGSNTRLKIGFNLTGTDETTAMSGTGTLEAGGILRIPAGVGTNPLIRADGTMMLLLQYGETPGAATYLYPSTMSTGSFVATGAASKKITWRILEVGSTA
jgi:hypothetical protein